MNINADMKLSHISSTSLSYGTDFRENAISLVADNLRWQMFRKPNLEKWFVVKRSLPRSGAYGLEMFCLFADWKDGELLIEILFISDFTIFVNFFRLFQIFLDFVILKSFFQILFKTLKRISKSITNYMV